MKHWIFLTILFVFTALLPARSQELNAVVTINSDQITGTNKSVFTALESAMKEFLNNRRFTEMTFAPEERIDCTFSFIVSEYIAADDNFNKVELTVQARRPVYGANYNSTIFNFRDTYINFNYKESDRLDFNENMFLSNVSSLLAYYAYIIIGLDADSYSRQGGTPFFRTAENVALAAQSSDYAGWRAFDKEGEVRYTLVNNLNDEAFKKFRGYFYEYHRLGLDEMTDNTVNARARIADGLPTVREANRARPSGLIVTAFMDAKSDELINIFSEGPKEQRQAVYDVLMDISPTRKSQLDAMIKN
ncbi:DUF4835 family protein [Paludibacteraceae bacterium OttesenSCG-928-F17]|nr:DUF4835 family protein [Paludibacteraceae bacterium OttesenSCG-928-F17]